METVFFSDLGAAPYADAWALQERLAAPMLDAKAAWYNAHGPSAGLPHWPVAHHLLFCSHPHVYTLGKSGKPAHLLADDARLQAMGATFTHTNRGGDITYHGPGQIVGYPVLDLERFFTDLGRYMRALEEVIIRAIGHWGIQGGRLEGATGVWLDADDPARARKICAMGVKCSRWVTMHGWALNVNTDLSYFDAIVPCGIRDKGVTSMQAELNRPVDEEDVKAALRDAFGSVFCCLLRPADGQPAGVPTPIPHAALSV